jgi:four helix bundle protein
VRTGLWKDNEESEGPVAGLRTYRDLDAWKVGMAIVEHTYALSRLFPAEERFELSSQMRRAAVSIPSNVAEGFARGAARVCAHFARMAVGSAAELETQLEVARRLRFVSAEAAEPLRQILEKERQILHGLIRDRERQIRAPRPTDHGSRTTNHVY